jgi:hypothetical protein
VISAGLKSSSELQDRKKGEFEISMTAKLNYKIDRQPRPDLTASSTFSLINPFYPSNDRLSADLVCLTTISSPAGYQIEGKWVIIIFRTKVPKLLTQNKRR